jgi:type II secretion system protein N
MNTPKLPSFIASRPLFAKIAGYALFFIAALAVMIYLRFPTDAMGKVIQSALVSAPVTVNIGGVSLTLPPGLALKNVSLSDKSSANNHIVSIQRLKLRPSILSAITGNQRAILSADMLGGDVDAKIDISGEKNEEINIEFGFSNINPGAGQWWDQVPWGRLEANIDGEGAFFIPGAIFGKAVGHINISLDKGMVIFSKTMGIKLPDIAIDSGELEVNLKSRRLTIENARVVGPDFSATITGNIFATSVPKFSRINLEVKISMEKSFEEKLGPLTLLLPPEKGGVRLIRIGGNMEKPDIRF